MKEKEHPLINFAAYSVLFTIVTPLIVFFLLLFFDTNNIVNDIIAASTLGLFIAASMTMLIAFTNLLKEKKIQNPPEKSKSLEDSY